jgi:hypothetical protein
VIIITTTINIKGEVNALVNLLRAQQIPAKAA